MSYNDQFHFTLAGPSGSNAVIFGSTDLQTWTPLATNPLIGGSLNFTDTLATNFPRRFYRALLRPWSAGQNTKITCLRSETKAGKPEKNQTDYEAYRHKKSHDVLPRVFRDGKGDYRCNF